MSNAVRSPNAPLVWIGGKRSNGGLAREGAEWDRAGVGANQESTDDAILATSVKDANIVFGNRASNFVDASARSASLEVHIAAVGEEGRRSGAFRK